MSRLKKSLLAVVLICQLGVLLGEYLNSIYPHYFGEEVQLKIVPVDPRSLFRGQYARLDYEIGTIPMSMLTIDGEKDNLRAGEIIFVNLKKRGGVYEVMSAQLEMPDEEIFIRGRVDHSHSISQDTEIQVKYGIEAFFASPEKAIEVERQARSRGTVTTARVMIAPNGKAALLDVVSH